MEARLFKIASQISLAILVASVLVIALHLGPLEDKLNSKYVAVDGTVWLFIGSEVTRSGRSGGVWIPLQFVVPLAAVLPVLWMVRYAIRAGSGRRGGCASLVATTCEVRPSVVPSAER